MGVKHITLNMLNGSHEDSFAQLSYYCHNLKLANEGTVTHIKNDVNRRFEMVFVCFGFTIRSFIRYMRPLIIIDAARLKGKYKGINLVAVGMDDNNQIVPITVGVTQGETSFEKWSRAYCPANCYNYMTSNNVELVNSLSRLVRKLQVTRLIEYFRDLLQRWYYDEQHQLEDAPLDELTPWAAAKVKYKMLKSTNWKFMKTTLKATYQELVYPLKDVSMWEAPNDLQRVLPSSIVKPQLGRPKNTNRILSIRESPSLAGCSRCGIRGHNQNACNQPLPSQKVTVVSVPQMATGVEREIDVWDHPAHWRQYSYNLVLDFNSRTSAASQTLTSSTNLKPAVVILKWQ
nr:transposase, MuDR, MULE transposase domain protein [Tanacetum cinerariifolium]